jgi:ethanolamine utilization protein EutL
MMAILDPIIPRILSARLIPNVHPEFAKEMNLRSDQKSLALVTCDIDDSLYASLDEATKKADVEVVYAHSFYAGSAHASGPLSGEIIGILAGPNPTEARAGLTACIDYAQTFAHFHAANEDGSLAFFAHMISRSGSYLSAMANVPEGSPLAYLIAPPIEATFAIDAALKRAEVALCLWFKPPSETNFSGALLTGTQSDCQAACLAFQEAVLDLASAPLKY